MSELRLEELICRPIVTEKAARLQEHNTHIFEVDRGATKLQIKSAIEKLFNVKVSTVRTMIMPHKWKRFGQKTGRIAKWKKALVILAPGQNLEVLETK